MADQNTLGDILVRLRFSEDGDALDFKKTRRAFLLVEDGVAELPIPSGPPGKEGPQGPPGSSLAIDLVLDEESDNMALEKLRDRTSRMRAIGTPIKQFFAINKVTKTGFVYTRGGWVMLRNLFGDRGEIAPGEFNMPAKFNFVENEPATPVGGIVVYAHGGQLKMKNSAGQVKVLG